MLVLLSVRTTPSIVTVSGAKSCLCVSFNLFQLTVAVAVAIAAAVAASVAVAGGTSVDVGVAGIGVSAIPQAERKMKSIDERSKIFFISSSVYSNVMLSRFAAKHLVLR